MSFQVCGTKGELLRNKHCLKSTKDSALSLESSFILL